MKKGKSSDDRLPPHSPEAEQGVLGCILLSPDTCLPECLAQFRKRKKVFYDLRHQIIYETMAEMHDAFQAIDLITLSQELKKKNQINEVGLPYLASLPDTVPSSANLSYYLDIVLEKWEMRRIIQTCTQVAASIYDFKGSLEDLKTRTQRDLDDVFGKRDEAIDIVKSWNELLAFDTENDENCIIGFNDHKTTRYLCRSHLCWLIGPSGIGKSSFLIALAAHFASGRPFCAVSPGKPRKILVIQAENDIGDLAEMAQGIEEGNSMDVFSDRKCAELLNANLITLSVVGCIGREFCQWLRRKIIQHRAEIVIIDPMLSFAGIDFSKQSDASLFFRVWLLPVLMETGVVLISGHHTGKPAMQQSKAPRTIFDMMYDGLGSSELVNFARAVMLLQPAGEDSGKFRLILAKRGKRAWARHPDGSPSITLWLQHGSAGINWEQISPPEENQHEPKSRDGKTAGGKPSKINEICSMNLFDFCAACKTEGEGLREISRRLEAWLARHDLAVAGSTCARAILELVARKKLSKGEDLLFRRGKEG